MEKISSMQELARENKKEIYKDKLNILEKGIASMKLSTILEAESTSKEKDFKPFWNSYSKKISEKLWLPRLIDGPGSEQWTFSHGFLSTSERSSQFLNQNVLNLSQKNLQMTSWKLSQFSPQGITEEENTVTRKIRFYPDKVQKQFLKHCFGHFRCFYNKAVEHIDKNKDYRSFYTVRDAILKHKEDWMEETPFDSKAIAIRYACQAFKGAAELQSRGKCKHFKVKFKSKKNKNEVCGFSQKALKTGYLLAPKRLKFCKNNRKQKKCKKKCTCKNHSKLRFRTKMRRWIEKEFPKSTKEFTITKNNSGRYYLNLSYTISQKPYKQLRWDNRDEIVALDPGKRTFQTFYSEKECGKLGHDFCSQIKPLHEKIDKFNSLLTRKELTCTACASKTRYHMRKRCSVLRTKIQNKVTNLHWQIASWLTGKYKVILIPIFETSQMYGNLHSSVNRYLQCLSHYTFRQRLIYKGKQKYSQVITCLEPYTTKTCGNCGQLNEKITAEKIFSCAKCKAMIDRDYNGARNILLRSLTQYENN